MSSKLSSKGEEEFVYQIERAKVKIKNICEEILGEIYIHIPEHIESDSWLNFRNAAFDALYDYSKLDRWGASKIREAILRNHRDQIIADLNQDLLKENEQLKNANQELRERRFY